MNLLKGAAPTAAPSFFAHNTPPSGFIYAVAPATALIVAPPSLFPFPIALQSILPDPPLSGFIYAAAPAAALIVASPASPAIPAIPVPVRPLIALQVRPCHRGAVAI